MEKKEIISKTPSQLANQVRQVNLYRILGQALEPFSLPSQDFDLPSINRDHPEYSTYLESLRALRRFQHGQFQEHTKQHPEQIQIEPRYYEASFDPNLANLVLGHLSKTGDLKGFKPQKLAELTQNEDDFINFLSTKAKSSGLFVRTYFPILENTIPTERLKQDMKTVITSFRSTNDFWLVDRDIGLPRILTYVPKEDIKRTFHTIAEGQKDKEDPSKLVVDPGFLSNLFDIKNIGILFNNPQLHDLAKKFVDNTTGIYLGNDFETKVEDLIKNGVLDQPLLEKIVFQAIKGIDFVSTAFQVLKYTPQITQEQLHDAFMQAFSETIDKKHLLALGTTVAYLSEEERLTIAKRLVQIDPNYSWVSLTNLHRVFSESSWHEIIEMMINHPNLRWFDEIRGIIEHTKELKPEQRYSLFKQLVSRWDQYKTTTKDKKRSQENIQALFDGYRDSPRHFLKTLPADKRAEIARIIINENEVDSGYFGSVFNDCIPMLDGDSLIEMVDDALKQNSSKLNIYLGYIDEWANKVEDQPFLEFVKRIASHSPEQFINYLDSFYILANRFSITEVESVVRILAFANPFAALEFVKGLKEEKDFNIQLDEKEILDIGFTNQQKIDLAPKLLRDIFHQLSVTGNEKIKAGLKQEGAQLYRQIQIILREGFGHIVKSIHSREDLTLKQERELLDIFYGYARIKSKQQKIFEGLNLNFDNLSLGEAKMFLFKVIDKKLGRSSDTTPEETRLFLGIMETPVPFLIYLANLAHQFGSELNLGLLKEIYHSLIRGEFSKWKYRGIDEVALSGLKSDHLLPDQLSIAQYEQWQQDEETTLYDTLSVNSGDIAQQIGQYLKDNLEHLSITSNSNVVNKVALAGKMESLEDSLQKIQEDIRHAGEALQGINEQLKTARREGNSNLISIYEQAQKEGELKRKGLIRAKTIIRLMNLSPEEVSAGTFLEGKDKKQKGEIFTRVLGKLREQAVPDDAFVYDEVKRLLAQVQGVSETSQNIFCVDSANPKVTLEIGEIPVVSCQNYDTGSYNECLLGYTEPGTKILIVRNARGSIIARSVFRLLALPDGQPALHVERIYSSVASKTIPRIIYTHALKKADEMGLSVVVSRTSKTETGHAEEALPAPGFSLKPVTYSLQAFAARAPYVYVDSGGGATNGVYKLEDLLQIKKAV